MKKIFPVFGLIFLTLTIFSVTFAQNDAAKAEMLGKISKLSQSKKQEDKDKAYQLSKDYLAKYSKDTDENTKKVKTYFTNQRLNNFTKAIDEIKMKEAIEIGEEIIADEPDNSSIPLNLAYGSFQALVKNKDNSFVNDGINYAKTTLEMFNAGKLPAKFEPFKNQSDATSVMYYVLGNLFIDIDLQTTATNFYKAIGLEGQIKNIAHPYYMIAFYYEKQYESVAKDFNEKHGNKTSEDAAMKADIEKMNKILDRMLDAYARAIKVAEIDKDANKDSWNQRFTQVYQFHKKTDAGMATYLSNIMSTPMPDPSTL